MGPLLEFCACLVAQEPQAAPWRDALPAKGFPGIASSVQVGNFLSANLTLPYNENCSNLKAFK